MGVRSRSSAIRRAPRRGSTTETATPMAPSRPAVGQGRPSRPAARIEAALERDLPAPRAARGKALRPAQLPRHLPEPDAAARPDLAVVAGKIQLAARQGQPAPGTRQGGVAQGGIDLERDLAGPHAAPQGQLEGEAAGDPAASPGRVDPGLRGKAQGCLVEDLQGGTDRAGGRQIGREPQVPAGLSMPVIASGAPPARRGAHPSRRGRGAQREPGVGRDLGGGGQIAEKMDGKAAEREAEVQRPLGRGIGPRQRQRGAQPRA